jgi:hypothetical protein
MSTLAIRFDHLLRLTDDVGILEHADGPVPRRANGYTTDDNARALLATCSQERPELIRATETYLAFLYHAYAGGGRFRNRLLYERTWAVDHADGDSDDACGRALWALGEASVRSFSLSVRVAARTLFERASGFRSPWLRSTSFAVLGAAALAIADPSDIAPRALLNDASLSWRGRTRAGGIGPWPEPRLGYANATVPEALLALGEATDDHALVAEGLRLLSLLVEIESVDDHFSFTPSGGWQPGEPRPGFDQQPIEAAAMASACARAWRITGHPRWAAAVAQAGAWFDGRNDSGVPMIDPITFGGYDGLRFDGVNSNQGAESTRLHASDNSKPSAGNGPSALGDHRATGFNRVMENQLLRRAALITVAVGLVACGTSTSSSPKTTASSPSVSASVLTTATTPKPATSSSATSTASAAATTPTSTSTVASTVQLEKAVTTAFTVFFDGRSTVDAKVNAVEKGEQFREMLTDAAKDPQAAQLSTVVHAVKTLDGAACNAAGVTSPCAEVRHDLFVGSFPAASDKTSYAVRANDRWVVAALSWCAFVALGGSTCPAV